MIAPNNGYGWTMHSGEKVGVRLGYGVKKF